jgi:enamine deaminase RidA (YjgF/YER057c/UK114 family)
MQLNFVVLRLVRRTAFCAGLLCAAAGARATAQVVRLPLPNGSTFPIAQGVWVGKTLYLSGMLDPTLSPTAPAGNTETQSTNALKAIEAALKAQKLTMGDVVMMHVFLAGDPANGGKMDFKGFMAAYTQFFGTKEQPNKPARSAMQVAALAAPTGLVEIEVIAVKPE